MRLCPLRPLAKEKWVLGNPRNMGPLSRGTLKPALARSSMGARSPILQATCLWQSRPASPGGRQRPHPHFPEEQTEKGGQSPDCHSWGVGGDSGFTPRTFGPRSEHFPLHSGHLSATYPESVSLPPCSPGSLCQPPSRSPRSPLGPRSPFSTADKAVLFKK